MTSDEAISCVKFLKKMFPTFDPDDDAERLRTTRNALLPLRSEAEVKRAIEKQFRISRFADIPAIVAACESHAVDRRGERDEKIAAARAQAEQRLREIAAEKQSRENETQRQRRLIEALNAETARRLHRAAVATLEPSLRSFFEKRPITSPAILPIVARLAENKRIGSDF